MSIFSYYFNKHCCLTVSLKKTVILFSLRLPIFKKILIGISKSKNPTDILLDIIRVLEEGIEKNTNQNALIKMLRGYLFFLESLS